MAITQWTKALPEEEVPDGDVVGVDVAGEKVCVAKVDGKYYAINDICSHFYTRLSDGELDAQTLSVECPLHDSRFSLIDGAPNQEPADEPVDVYDVKVENGEVYVGPKTDGTATDNNRAGGNA
ncbi:Rieske 2Fe-2S domain-containing protein [Nocardia sp. R7R-8]|uniref:Rieske 2Fe-2S domain-containing protein n=1 Tax=Nocardia sp. R7R-8 TaxID=3459304 RepID=UPI00403DCBC3